jgi:hypothetical protein
MTDAESKRRHRGAAFGVDFAELSARVAGRTGAGGRPLCAWCEAELGPRRRTWCSDRCANAYWDGATWRGLRAQLGKRDRGVCALCRVDCRALRRAYAQLPKHKRAKFAEGYGIPSRRRRKTWWDADHIVPIAEGGLNALDNLRTLCIRCHKAETKSLNARRTAARRAADPPWQRMLRRANALLDAVEATPPAAG